MSSGVRGGGVMGGRPPGEHGGGVLGGRPPGEHRGRADQAAAVAAAVEPVISAAGVDTEGVEVAPIGRRRLVRIFVDKNGGVSLDEIAEISTAISKALDERDVLGPSPYVLEVSSPGVDRPLTAPRHWHRAAGRLVRATMIGGSVVAGRVVDADDTAATIEVDGAQRRVSYAEIAKAKVEVEFNRPPSGPEEPGEDEEV